MTIASDQVVVQRLPSYSQLYICSTPRHKHVNQNFQVSIFVGHGSGNAERA